MKKIFNRFSRYVKRIYKIILRPEMKVLPSQIAYYVVLSFIPMVTVVGLIASQFSISLTNVITTMAVAVPKEIVDLIAPILSTPTSTSIYSIIIASFLASNATNSIIIASNMMFKIEDSDYLRRRIKALIMLLILIILFLFMILVLGYGNTILTITLNYFEIEIPMIVYYLFNLVKIFVSFIIIYILVKAILTFAPDQDIPSRRMTKGAIFITVSWMLATECYSIYAANYANYNVFYSSLANIVVLMIWAYILSYTLVIGLAINSENYIYEMKIEAEIREEEQRQKLEAELKRKKRRKIIKITKKKE